MRNTFLSPPPEAIPERPDTHKPALLKREILLILNRALLGGVGVSGGTKAQDVECARAGLDAIGAE
jgi:uncharacterized protein GlcG (DUF336 family)